MAVVSVRAKDGIVIAADAGSSGSEVLTSSLHVSDSGLAWGCAGPRVVGEYFRQAVEKKDRDEPGWVTGSPDADCLSDALTAIARPALTSARREGVEPRVIERTTILLAACPQSGPCAIIAYGNGSSEVVQGEHFATGSGELAATALMRQLAREDSDVRQAQIVAWAAVRQAIAWTPELEEPISLAVVSPGEQGNATCLMDECELHEIGATAELWLEALSRSAPGSQDDGCPEAPSEEPPSPPD